MSLNKIILVGRLTRDPELSYTPSGVAVAKFALAVDRPVPPKQNGEKETDFFDCKAWRNTAEVVSKYATKGALVAVDGRLEVRQYEKDGQKRRAYEVVANDVRLLGSRQQGGDSGGYGQRDGGGYGQRDSGGYSQRDSGGYSQRDSGGYGQEGGGYASAPSYPSNDYGSGDSSPAVDDLPF